MIKDTHKVYNDILHFLDEVNQSYLCNPRTCAHSKKLTKDINLVTCRNCLGRYYKKSHIAKSSNSYQVINEDQFNRLKKIVENLPDPE